MLPAAILLSLSTALASVGLGLAAAADPTPSVGVAVTSDTFVGLELRGLTPRPLFNQAGKLALGAGLDLPLMLWLRGGGLDTGRLVLQGSAIPFRADHFALGTHVQTRIGIQQDNQGRRIPWDASASVQPGLPLGRSLLGIEATWQQGLSTHIHHGERAHDAFQDLYPDGSSGDGPEDGWVAFPSARWRLGLIWTRPIGEHAQIMAAASSVGTPRDDKAGAFDAMMIGVWPFFMEVGLTLHPPPDTQGRRLLAPPARTLGQSHSPMSASAGPIDVGDGSYR